MGEVTKAAKGGGTVTAAGSPNNAFAVVVKITAQGTLNTAAFAYSIDGGNTYSDEITVPVAGKYEFPGTGVTVTFAAASDSPETSFQMCIRDSGKAPPPGGEETVANKAVCELLGLKSGAATSDVTAKIMELKGGIIDGVNVMAELKILKDTMTRRDADEAVTHALKAGKITPAQKEWATSYALSLSLIHISHAGRPCK